MRLQRGEDEKMDTLFHAWGITASPAESARAAILAQRRMILKCVDEVAAVPNMRSMRREKTTE
jgi:hypothetical protein